jgi:serine/threonine protein kinase
MFLGLYRMKTRHRHQRTPNKTKKRGGWSFFRKIPISKKSSDRSVNMTYENLINIKDRFKASTKKLGKGSFGIVKLVNGRVVKKLATSDNQAKHDGLHITNPDEFTRELSLTQNVSRNNPYVSTYENLPSRNNHAKYLLLEKMGIVNDSGFSESGSELYEAINKTPKTINKSNVKGIIIELLKGLDSIHARHILHLDIKPENIWVFPDNKKIKYFDFGLSCYMDSNSTGCHKNNVVGTPDFLKNQKGKIRMRNEQRLLERSISIPYSKEDDFYALTMTITEILQSVYDEDNIPNWGHQIVGNLSRLTKEQNAIDAIVGIEFPPTP